MLRRKLIKRVSLILSILVAVYVILMFPTTKDVNYNIISKSSNGVIYLLNKDNYLSRLEMVYESKDDINKIYEILDLVTIESDSSYKIKNDFYGYIPRNTKILDLYIDDNILYIDFSRDILNYKDKEKMLEGITYSITSNIDINFIKLLVNGDDILYDGYLDRSIRINKEYNVNSLNDITSTTIYYPAKENDIDYFIPVTKVDNNKNEKIEIIIDELKSSSSYNTNIVSFIDESTQLIDYQLLDNTLLLNFNKSILGDINTNSLLEEVTYSINLSINDNYNVDSVMYTVEDDLISNYFLLLG